MCDECYVEADVDEDCITSNERCEYVSYWESSGQTAAGSVKGRLKNSIHFWGQELKESEGISV